jgi:uncharacterized protein involved in exopolysaccharide biosynthesis
MGRTVDAERDRQDGASETIDFGAYAAVFRKVWWQAGIFSLAVAVGTFGYVSRLPNSYTARAVVAPTADENSQPRLLGALSSFGIDMGGASKVEDLEVLFKSDDLAARVFAKYPLWPVVLGDEYDPATGTVRAGWLDRFLGNDNGAKPPGAWEAIRLTRRSLQVAINKKAGAVTLAFTSPSAEGSAKIVLDILEEARSRLQEEVLDRTTRNRKFIEEQIVRTIDPLVKDRLYAMLGQEMEKEMMARNREHFGFRIIDSPRAPDRKSGPYRGRSVAVAAVLSFLAYVAVAVAGSADRNTDKA